MKMLRQRKCDINEDLWRKLILKTNDYIEIWNVIVGRLTKNKSFEVISLDVFHSLIKKKLRIKSGI